MGKLLTGNPRCHQQTADSILRERKFSTRIKKGFSNNPTICYKRWTGEETIDNQRKHGVISGLLKSSQGLKEW